MFAAALHALRRRFCLPVDRDIEPTLSRNIVHVGKRHVFDFENMVDTRNTGQGVANSQTLVFHLLRELRCYPSADDSERLIIVL
ncbi:Uncharacterised protein [Escherichia coli]|uniref:Uncharacterized protein n=1 Tax=Escherichia coli TaxID=562 RepID=A0A376W2R8_ECOLX|nr:Uncharacterised protein [Escherichia coli]